MLKDGFGLRALLQDPPPGSNLEDARRLYKRLSQQSRKPSKLMDERYGVSRG